MPALLNYDYEWHPDQNGHAWKASTIALVDTIEPPIVRLDDGKVIQVSTVEQAERIRPHVSKILYLGDMLISYGDFLENNAQLPPASFVEEIWDSSCVQACLQCRHQILIGEADSDG